MKNKHTPLLINPFLNMAVGIKVRSVPFNKKKKKQMKQEILNT